MNRSIVAPTRIDTKLANTYRSQGLWSLDTLENRLQRGLARSRDNLAIVDGTQRITYRLLGQHVSALSTALLARGVQAGDVVGFLLPNWWEAAVVHLAAARIGAISNPLHTIYRQHELRFVLAEAGTRVVFAPAEFRGHQYADFVREAAADCGSGTEVFEVRGSGDFEAMVQPHVSDNHAESLTTVTPSGALLLMYTSGTTSCPKGVIHTHETMLRAGDDLADLFTIGESDVMFIPSPMTHITGLVYLQIALGSGIPSVLLDQWDAPRALDLVIQEGCTYMGGATPFLKGLVEEASSSGIAASSIPLNRGTCGGADVPSDLIGSAETVLGASFVRVYGLTEGVTVTASDPADSLSRRGGSDGRALPGMSVRVVGPFGEGLPAGSDGEILVRGPANFLGYLDSSHNAAAFTEDGWIRTGDAGRLDSEGFLRVTGRIKDIIIRGGENVSVREIEELMLSHPAIKQVAVVGMPDERLGEKACAFVVPIPGADVTLADVVAFLKEKQTAPQKLPEKLVVVEGGLPMTPSGKIQKFKLREAAARLVAEGTV